MLPSDLTLSTGELGILEFLSPLGLNSDPNNLRQWRARGGVNIFDGSKGINVKDWTFYLWGPGVWAVEGTEVSLGKGWLVYELDPAKVLELSCTFDRNMDPQIAWRTAEGCFFRWYDSAAEDYVVTHFPNATRILLTHDDVRDESQAESDVICTWLEAGRIYYAIQRERYTIVNEVTTPAPGRVIELHNFGMTRGYRLQWEYTYGTD